MEENCSKEYNENFDATEFIENKLKKIEIELNTKQKDIEQAYLESIETIRYIVDEKDSYTKGHSERVSEYSVLIGKKLGIDSDNLNALRIGGLLHDIGKIKTPSKILTKKANLSEEEYTEIKKHPLIGAQILSNVSVFCDIIPIVKYHHERYDGTGYPEHLKGEEIPLLARIVSVADSFDAMSSKRSYKDNMDIQQIINEISNNKNTQFDSHVADALLEILTNNYNAIIEIQNRYKIED